MKQSAKYLFYKEISDLSRFRQINGPYNAVHASKY